MRNRTHVRHAMRLYSSLLLVAGTLAFTPTQTEAKKPAKPAKSGKPKQSAKADHRIVSKVVVYDVRDLLMQTPDFTSAPQIKLRTTYRSPTFHTIVIDDDDGYASTVELIEQLINLIQDLVGRQEDWQAYGGTVSSIRELNGNLIIKATPAMQKDVANLLNQLRSAKTLQVATDALFVRVRSTVLEQFKKEHADGTPVLNEKAAERFAAMALDDQHHDDIQLVGTVRLLGFNGQRVFAVGLNQPTVEGVGPKKVPERIILSLGTHLHHGTSEQAEPNTPNPDNDAKTIEGRDKALRDRLKKNRAGQPMNDSLGDLQGGTIIDVSPQLSHDRKHITMTLRSYVAVSDQPNSKRNSKSKSKTKANPKPQTHLTTINTTIHIPNKGGVLLGAAAHGLKQGKADGDVELIVFLRARAVISKH